MAEERPSDSLVATSEGRRYVSPQQVSQALGVGESTIKRWVDTGRLPAHRTPGGHRRILVEHVIELVSRENLPHLDLSRLTGTAVLLPGLPMEVPALNERLYRTLLASDHAAARALVSDAHQAGLSVARLGDEVIAPVMARVGHGWANGELDVFEEHRGTQVCLSALEAVKARLESPGSVDVPLAIGGGPEFDHYLLANLLVEMLLLQQGWRVVNLGPNTPLASFRRALRQLQPQMLWISCSYLADADAFVTGYRPLYEEAEQAEVAVAVGGQALTEAVRGRITFTHHGDRLAHLAAFAHQVSASWRRRG